MTADIGASRTRPTALSADDRRFIDRLVNTPPRLPWSAWDRGRAAALLCVGVGDQADQQRLEKLRAAQALR